MVLTSYLSSGNFQFRCWLKRRELGGAERRDGKCWDEVQVSGGQNDTKI